MRLKQSTPAVGISRRSCVALLGLTLSSLMAPAVWARRYEGFEFADTLVVAGDTLHLNGVGLRQVAWFKGYAAGLYVTQPSHDALAILSTVGQGAPMRLTMGLMYGVGTQEFTKAVRSGIRKNYSEADQAHLADRVARFDAVMQEIGEVHKGDVIHIDSVPDQGLVIQVNGRLRGQPITGADFARAFMAIFIGQRPVDERLKAGLLSATVAGR